jgi:predicted RecA/RadA family phage recombinase
VTLLVTLGVIIASTMAVAQTASPASVNGLSFMSGCWATPKGTSPEIRECYTAPYAGLIQGSSQTVTSGKTTQVEFIAIRESAEGVTYAPIFNGKALSTFTLSRVEGPIAVFENAQNDFPKKIIYRQDADKSLVIRLEGARPDDANNQEMRLMPQGM